jgi:ABC-type methionine transport system ATPase subunit
MVPPHIELRNVSKSVLRRVSKTKIRTQLILDLDLIVHQCELVTIMGASGSGKTTLLRLINRLSEVDSGNIFLNGKDITEYPPMQLRRKIGLVFQFPVIFQGSVRENLAFGAKLWGNTVDIEALARDMGIPEKLLDADADQLSGGEKQRVCIARAIANQPEVLLLDEPTSSLDLRSAEKIEELLLALRRDQNMTVLWVTHEKEQARRIGGRRFILWEGKLVEDHG